MTIAEFEKQCGCECNHYGKKVAYFLRKSKLRAENFIENQEDERGNLEGILINKLTADEAAYILSYTGSNSSWLNEDLRDGSKLKNECKEFYALALENTLRKVPSFNNEIVIRMEDPPCDTDEMLKWFDNHIGHIVSTPYFLSTAKEKYSSSLTWRIATLPVNTKGKDISNITNAPKENEILFMRNATFSIEGVDYESKAVILKEVEGDDLGVPLVGAYWTR